MTRRGQYLVTVPKALAEALNLTGAYLLWEVVGRDVLRVRVVRPSRRHEPPVARGPEPPGSPSVPSG